MADNIFKMPNSSNNRCNIINPEITSTIFSPSITLLSSQCNIVSQKPREATVSAIIFPFISGSNQFKPIAATKLPKTRKITIHTADEPVFCNTIVSTTKLWEIKHIVAMIKLSRTEKSSVESKAITVYIFVNILVTNTKAASPGKPIKVNNGDANEEI